MGHKTEETGGGGWVLSLSFVCPACFMAVRKPCPLLKPGSQYDLGRPCPRQVGGWGGGVRGRGLWGWGVGENRKGEKEEVEGTGGGAEMGRESPSPTHSAQTLLPNLALAILLLSGRQHAPHSLLSATPRPPSTPKLTQNHNSRSNRNATSRRAISSHPAQLDTITDTPPRPTNIEAC